MPELELYQWAGVIGAAAFAAYRAWPMVKAKLPTVKAKVAQPWERERIMFDHLVELTRYCNDRGATSRSEMLRDNVLPLLLTASEEVPDETD